LLAIGSKAAGVALMLRLVWEAVPPAILDWRQLAMAISALTVLYGNLCALPQRNLKRLLGYSSIGHAGYLMLGVAAGSIEGGVAVLFYLAGYLFALLAVFAVIGRVAQAADRADIEVMAGLYRRAPGLAAVLALALVSLAGVPPLVGFLGKFLLLKAVLVQAPAQPAYYVLAAVGLAGILISYYYYFGVIRVLYWAKASPDADLPLTISPGLRVLLGGSAAGMLCLGIWPNALLAWAEAALQSLARGTL